MMLLRVIVYNSEPYGCFLCFQTFLPSLAEIIAHHNNITVLDNDFHGLPSLCLADLSFNQIRSVNYDLISKSKCVLNGVPGIMKIQLEGEYVGMSINSLISCLIHFAFS